MGGRIARRIADAGRWATTWTRCLLLYVGLLRELGVPGLNAAGPAATFGLANELGRGDQISNRVVDALGDVAGGVRLHGVSEPVIQ